jgi:hypothetical protein
MDRHFNDIKALKNPQFRMSQFMKNTSRHPISRRKFLAGAAAVGISFKLPKDA